MNYTKVAPFVGVDGSGIRAGLRDGAPRKEENQRTSSDRRHVLFRYVSYS